MSIFLMKMQNNKKNCVQLYLPNDLCDAIIARAKENGNTHQEEILFRIAHSFNEEHNMQATDRFKTWLESRRKSQ